MNYPIIFNAPTSIKKHAIQAWPQARLLQDCPAEDAAAKFAIIWAGNENFLEQITCCIKLGCKVLVLSDKGTLSELQQALSAGAQGYIDAATDQAALKVAANSISQGALWIPNELLNNLVGILNQQLPVKTNEDELFATLTARELATVKAVRQGLSNKEVAIQLNISERTVKQHLSSSFQKLGVKDRVQLALLGR